MAQTDMHGGGTANLVQSKLDEFFWEWLCLADSQKIVQQAVRYAKTGDNVGVEAAPSPSFTALSSRVPGSPSGRTAPSPPGSPGHARNLLRESSLSTASTEPGTSGGEWTSGSSTSPTGQSSVAARRDALNAAVTSTPTREEPLKPEVTSCAAGTSQVIPRFWWPKRQKPAEALPQETKQKIREYFAKEGLQEITTHQQLEPIVTEIFGLSRYFVVPIFHKIKVFFDIVDESASKKAHFLSPSTEPLTEQMIVGWAQGRIQPDDPVLSFFWVVKKDHNNWIEREDFGIFLTAILLTHPGLDFLRETAEFQDRYADTVISRIFFVYDRKDTGRIYMQSLRRYKPSVIETWKQLADHDDIKMVRDYFSYEHFYVIYCTFWELDSDHDFLLDKDDLLKYDGHTLSRRAVDRIFSEIPARFTSAVPGKMGYEDFIRFLLCDQDRQTDRSVEYWFSLFDLDGDGCIRDHEMKYFYEEQVQRMECLNYETISFADIMCQVNDMIWPGKEGHFRLSDFKKRRKFAGTFFSLFSSLNKFLTFEHRDPSLAKQEQLDNPTFSDWDRWCANEYLRLAMEEGGEGDEENTRVNDDGGG